MAFEQGSEKRRRMSPAEKFKEEHPRECKGTEELSCMLKRVRTVGLIRLQGLVGLDHVGPQKPGK